MYTGYLKQHGIKVLTVVLPNRIITSLYGAVPERQNNNALLNMQPEISEQRANGEHVVFFSLWSYGDITVLFQLMQSKSVERICNSIPCNRIRVTTSRRLKLELVIAVIVKLPS